MKKTVLVVVNAFFFYALCANPCASIENKIHTLNEILESNSLSKLSYNLILLEIMKHESNLEECQKKEEELIDQFF